MSEGDRTRTLIMAVPFRQDRVRNAIRLASEAPGEIVWDRKRSIKATFFDVLRTAGEDPVIVLQDDVYLAPGWREQVEEIISEHPESLCQFFSIRQSDLTHGSRYVAGRNYLMNQCFYLPGGYAEQLREFAVTWFEDNPQHQSNDMCMAAFLHSRGEKYWHQVPSLVQHHEWKSAVDPRRSSKRQSPTFEDQRG